MSDHQPEDVNESESEYPHLGSFVSLRQLLDEELDAIEKSYQSNSIDPTIATGFANVDYMTGGLRCGNLTVVAGSAGMAKSTFVQNIARRAAKDHSITVAMFNLQAKNRDVTFRIMCAHKKVSCQKMVNKALMAKDWERVGESVSSLCEGADIVMNDSNHSSVESIVTAFSSLPVDVEVGLVDHQGRKLT